MTNPTQFNAKNGLSVGSPAISVITSNGSIDISSVTGNISAYNITSYGTVTLAGSLHAPGTMTADSGMIAPTFTGVATEAANLYLGSNMAIPYQSSANSTAFLAAGPVGYALTSQGNVSVPTWSFLNSIPVVAPGATQIAVAAASPVVPDWNSGYLEVSNWGISQAGTYSIRIGGGGWHQTHYEIYVNGTATGDIHVTPNQQNNYTTFNVAIASGDTVQMFAYSIRGGDYYYQSSGYITFFASYATIYKNPLQLAIGARSF